MVRSAFSLSKRPTHKKGKYTYYVQFRDLEKNKYLTAKSVAVLLYETDLDPEQYPPSQRTAADFIVRTWMQTHSPFLHKKREKTVSEYCLTFWDYGKSPGFKFEVRMRN